MARKLTFKTRKSLQEIQRISTMKTAYFGRPDDGQITLHGSSEVDSFIKEWIKLWVNSWIHDPISDILEEDSN